MKFITSNLNQNNRKTNVNISRDRILNSGKCFAEVILSKYISKYFSNKKCTLTKLSTIESIVTCTYSN